MNDWKVKICVVVRIYIKVVYRNCAEETEKTKLILLGGWVLYHYMDLNQ